MIYADFDFYQTEYYGTSVDVSDFDRLALRASTFIDYYTMGKAQAKAELPAVKMCCCALAEQYRVIEQYASQSADGKALKSQTVGAWSQTYTSGAELEVEARKRLAGIVNEYLAPTGLLYRGVNRCVPTCCDCL